MSSVVGRWPLVVGRWSLAVSRRSSLTSGLLECVGNDKFAKTNLLMMTTMMMVMVVVQLMSEQRQPVSVVRQLIYRISSRITDIPKSDQDEQKKVTLTDLDSVFYLPDKEESFESFPTVHSIILGSKHST
uniref:Uncharacterized protein n=1 Tax=Glossina pallidipes TaxID=7398 RepID=A0A1A9ZTT6_GLOPL